MMADTLTWWMKRFDPVPELATLPLARARSKVYSDKRARASVAVAPELAATLSSDPADAATWLVAGVLAVLHRYRAEDPIVVGCGAPNDLARSTTTDPLLVMASVADSPTFAELVDRVRRAISDAAEHRIALAELVTGLGLGAVVNKNPLFAIAIRVADHHAPIADVRQDLTLELASGGASLELSYGARLFSPETAERFAGHVLTLLADAKSSPNRPIAELAMLQDAERRQLLVEWNATKRPIEGTTAHALFEQQARRAPDAEAVVYEGRRLTYGELDRHASALARRLRQMGARPGTTVGVSMTASERMMVALLGALKTGAAVVPLDWSFPAHRLATMTADARLTALVTESALASRFTPGVERVLLDTLGTTPDAGEGPLPTSGTARDVAYVLYTSGSKGVPKGVAMEHRSLVNLLEWQRRRGADPAGKRTLARTSIAFDVGWQEVLSTLCFGGALVVASDDVRADVSRLPSFLSEHGIARVFLPPVSLHQLAESVATQPYALPELREVIVAGEALHVSVPVMRLFRNLDATLDNHYGPTETHVVTAHRLEAPSTRWPALPPIGRPIDNARIYLLDEQRQPVPAGVVGELYVGGVPVARGYHDRDEATAQAFLPDPFAGEPSARMYRTGDLARYTDGGVLEFCGRRDDQIKLRGYRVELGDIESALRDAPGVTAAACVAHEDEALGMYLVAHVCTRDPDVSLASVRAFLEERLPAHMVPAANAFVRLPSLPLTATGKVDRRALPKPDRSIAVDATLATSTTSLEGKMATLFAKALSLPAVGANDDFISLGGHSLVAIKLVSEINDLYGIALPLASVLHGGTAAKVAARVEELLARGRGAAPATATAAVVRSLVEVELPGELRVLSPHRQETQYLYTDIFEHKTYDRAGIRYPDGGCYFDVGANVGLFTHFVHRRAKGARVFAFEPAPVLFEALRRNTLRLADMRIFDFALSNRNASLPLTYYPSLSGMSSFYPSQKEERALLEQILRNQASAGDAGASGVLEHIDEWIEQRLASVQHTCVTRRLSDVIAELGVEAIDLLKIDVQKAELDVLEGLSDADFGRVRQVVVEVHDLEGRVERVAGMLRARGYTVTVEQDPLHVGSVVHFVYAT